MHRGYIKLWRKVNDSKMYREHKLWVLWTYLLLNVTHKEIEVWAGRKKIKLLPGQIISGRNKLARETGLKPHSVYCCLQTLKNAQQIDIQSNNRFSIITVVNWKAYQGKDAGKEQQEQQQSQQQTSNKVTLNKNVKNIRSKNNPPGGSSKTKTKNKSLDDLIDHLEHICQSNTQKFSPKQFAMVCTRDNIHPNALIDAFTQAVNNYETIGDLWSYCKKIVDVQSGNYHEAETAAKSSVHKNNLQQLIKNMDR